MVESFPLLPCCMVEPHPLLLCKVVGLAPALLALTILAHGLLAPALLALTILAHDFHGVDHDLFYSNIHKRRCNR